MNSTLTRIQPMHDKQRLRVSPDVANMLKRLQSLRSGEYVIMLSVEHDGRMTWRCAELGQAENKR